MAGCGVADSPTVMAPTVAESNTQPLPGSVYGGRQPISGAHLYMYAADTTAYGHASDSLLKAYTSGSYPSTADSNGNYYVTTNSTGAFYLSSGQYSCTAGQQVYVYSIQGNAGGGNNTAAGLLAVLGQCQAGSQFTGVTAININEVSTVAAAYALAGYAVDATHIANAATNAAHVSAGTTTLAATGLANAFASANSLYNISQTGFGVARTTTPNGNGTVPQKLLHTLANVAANCVNTAGTSSPACAQLFADAESNGATGTAPTDTATALINIAHHPGINVTAIFNLSSSSVTPYSPNLGTTAPNDFTVAIAYTVTGLNTPGGMSVDASGNIWIPSTNGNGLVKLSPLGVPASGSPFTGGGIDYPIDTAIDASGNCWVTSPYSGEVIKFNSTGSTATAFAGNGGHVPVGIAVDTSGDIWFGDYTQNSISKMSSTGTEASGSPYSYTDSNEPGGIAIDTTGDVWVANVNSAYIARLTSAGANATYSPFSTGGSGGSRFPAIDASNGAWITNYSGNSLDHLTKNGTGGNYTVTTYTGGGLNEPNTMALDGAGNSWIANLGNSSVSEFTSTGTAVSGTNGYNNSVSDPFSVVVDGAGNVWVGNDGSSTAATSTITEFVGLAVPVVTPLVTALTNATLAAQP